jgi:hypothetical protein
MYSKLLKNCVELHLPVSFHHQVDHASAGETRVSITATSRCGVMTIFSRDVRFFIFCNYNKKNACTPGFETKILPLAGAGWSCGLAVTKAPRVSQLVEWC